MKIIKQYGYLVIVSQMVMDWNIRTFFIISNSLGSIKKPNVLSVSDYGNNLDNVYDIIIKNNEIFKKWLFNFSI